ncbi:Arsenate reductase [Candidatus Lokiarchaeum ossiferum]|uniref:Arsenate reductase n=1 Tax=Candidatus Lokiarchaeum ossiferum TaxID=2951803 RepID=A0ABY6HMI1_9ARCH|nr:Arsenate reductase [Candidatus Lokiarchaeum sp. B-35]
MNKPKLIFLCTGNSARSQMAEGLMRHHSGDIFEVYSAGLKAEGINPHAIEVMNEIGIDISTQKSKNITEYLNKINFDILITVCANADRNCPIIPGIKEKIHWGFEDPAAFQGSEGMQLANFREVRDFINTRIQNWLKINRPLYEK